MTLIGNWWRRKALSSAENMVGALKIIVLLVVILSTGACVNFQDAADLPAHGAQLTTQDTATGGFSIFPVAYRDIPGWRAERHSEVLPAFLKSCARLRKHPPEKYVGIHEKMGTISDWLDVCDDAKIIRPGNNTEAQYFFESRFIAYRVSNSRGNTGLITGYYEPVLRGAWAKDATFRYPLYSLPPDLISADLGRFDDKWKEEKIAGRMNGKQFVPYYSRSEIENGALLGRQLEILWVDDFVDSFFLHIQGSGRVVLPDGAHIRVGYAGRNGHRYTAVGRELVAKGVMTLDAVNMPSIRHWMEANPIAAQALMHKNKSFIFFHVLKGDGPVGSQGVVLTPRRSVAIDPKYWPLGSVVWIDTTEPGTRPAQPLRHLGVAQDSGSAIKGAVRADYFWGYGKHAGDKAGIMKKKVKLYMLLPRKAAKHMPFQTN